MFTTVTCEVSATEPLPPHALPDPFEPALLDFLPSFFDFFDFDCLQFVLFFSSCIQFIIGLSVINPKPRDARLPSQLIPKTKLEVWLRRDKHLAKVQESSGAR